MGSVFGNGTWVPALVLHGGRSTLGGFPPGKKMKLGAADELVNYCFSSPPALPAAAVVIQRRVSLDPKAGKTLQLSCGRSSLCSHPPDMAPSAALTSQETRPYEIHGCGFVFNPDIDVLETEMNF